MLAIFKRSMMTRIIYPIDRRRILPIISSSRKISKKEKIKNKLNIEDLMSNLYNFPEKQTALMTIQSLATLAKSTDCQVDVTYETLKENEHYHILDDLLKQKSYEFSLIKPTLIHLDILKFPSDCEIVSCLEDRLLNSNMKLKELVSLYNFFVLRKGTSSQSETIKKIQKKIEEKVSEFKDLSGILLVYKNSRNFSNSFLAALEEIVNNICEPLSHKELSRLLVVLAEHKRRNTTLLFTISYHLSQGNDVLSTKQLANIFYAICELNYFNKDLMLKLATNYVDQIDTVQKPTTVCAYLYCIKQSRYKDEKLLDALSTWIERNIDKCEQKHLSSYLLTLATVNYLPSNFDKISNLILLKLKLISTAQPMMWINCVWALVVLNKADDYLIGSVLSKSVYDSLPKGKASLTSRLRLLTINAVAKQLKSYDKDTLDPDLINEMVLDCRNNNPIQSEQFIKILENVFVSGKVAGNVLTMFGFPVGAVFILDSNKKTLMLDNFTDFGMNSNSMELPSSAFKVAAMFWSFKQYCYNSQDLIGEAILAINLLEQNGYKVLQMSHNELDTSLVNNIKIVNEKIDGFY